MSELVLFWQGLFVLVYFELALAMAILAGRNGRGLGSACTAFFLTLLLPPIGIVFAIIAKGNYSECPKCKSLNHPKADTCKNCGRDL